MTMTVPANGRFEWFVNPSTRPFVARKGGRETYTLTCEDAAGNVLETREVFVARGDVARLDVACGGALPAEGPAPTNSLGAPVPASPRATAPSKRRLSVRVVSVKRRGKRARVVLQVSGGTLRNAVVSLLDRRGRRLGAARVKTLRSGRRTVTVRARRTLRRGTVRVRVSATGLAARSHSLRLR
jgi:hypothetical protein